MPGSLPGCVNLSTGFYLRDLRAPDTTCPLPADQRDYRLYRAANGLLCLLIHDAHASQATAVYRVAAGSHAEPDDLPGLAHLLEHMLFMGSQRWPEPGSFPARVAEWGGRFNASTTLCHPFFLLGQPAGAAALSGPADRHAGGTAV
ncbi:insulinase family protein [Halopseudomonas pachastrellae]|nr:insulinase family protein [Halopseudomonas pachastrellae]